ncbi:hypothetical protein MA785_000791 [Vibrio parahaemolyticus]|nr:hypothetical protein [Vibrio parahaemolyticus]EJR2787900.1 hypothetical protein [Vibrio parahaemolyticus]
MQKNYLIIKEGADGKDLKQTRFAVSPASIEALVVPRDSHKPLMDNVLDKKNNHKIRQDLTNYLKRVGAWKPFYDEGQGLGKYFTVGLEDFIKEYRQQSYITQKDMKQGKVTVFLPETFKKNAENLMKKQRRT